MRSFTEGEYVIYPAHGVGRFIRTESQEISGAHIELFVIDFPKEKLTLRLPAQKALNSGLRPPLKKEDFYRAFDVLEGKKLLPKGVWNRRSQEYEHKINSGDPLALAEVIKELSSISLVNRSYSERVVYQTALERFAREYAIIEDIEESEAIKRTEKLIKMM